MTPKDEIGLRQEIADEVGFLLGVAGKDIIADSMAGQTVDDILSKFSDYIKGLKKEELPTNFETHDQAYRRGEIKALEDIIKSVGELE